MSITLTTTPSANVAAFAPVILAGSTTRNPFSGGLRVSKAINAYSNVSTFLTLSVTNGDDWEVGDTILIYNSSNDEYNKRHEITAVATTTITTATTYDGTASSGVGTVARMNDALNIKVEVENSSSTVISTMYANVDTSDGTWSIDISRALQYELSSYFSTAVSGEISTANASHSYTIVIYESWLDDVYVTTTDKHGTEPTTIGHLTTELPSDDNFQCGNYFYNSSFIVNYINDTNNEVRFKIDTASGTSSYSSTLAGTRWHYAYTADSTEDWLKFTAQENDDAGWVDLSDTIIVKNVGCSSQILYYLDRYGNYQGYDFHDYESTQKVTKVDKYTGESWMEKKMYGKEYVKGEHQDIRDIIVSPEVRDEDEEIVEVKTSALKYYSSDEVSPTITLRYNETLIQ